MQQRQSGVHPSGRRGCILDGAIEYSCPTRPTDDSYEYRLIRESTHSDPIWRTRLRAAGHRKALRERAQCCLNSSDASTNHGSRCRPNPHRPLFRASATKLSLQVCKSEDSTDAGGGCQLRHDLSPSNKPPCTLVRAAKTTTPRATAKTIDGWRARPRTSLQRRAMLMNPTATHPTMAMMRQRWAGGSLIGRSFDHNPMPSHTPPANLKGATQQTLPCRLIRTAASLVPPSPSDPRPGYIAAGLASCHLLRVKTMTLP